MANDGWMTEPCSIAFAAKMNRSEYVSRSFGKAEVDETTMSAGVFACIAVRHTLLAWLEQYR